MATLLVALGAAVFGVIAAPYAAMLIRETPPDPDDDPPPVPRVGPWLESNKLLAPLLAVIGAAVAAQTGAHPVAAAHVVAAVACVTLSVIDLDLFLLPKRIVWPSVGAVALLLGIAALVDGHLNPLERAVLCGVGGFGALLVLHIISPNGMGFGDVRLAGLIGLDLGWFGVQQVILGIFSGFAFAAVVGLALLAARRKKTRDPLPFGPFLALGMLFVLVGGDLLLGFARH
ncbi:MAG TPA: A24 family peptidase [Acidimicrobiales bacterium]|nr:A24 family peptidase [Acidimicrobiales bacterium]